MWELAGRVFAMPSEQRSTADAKILLPWFRHRSALFENLEDDVLLDVIKNAKLIKMKKDFVIVQQGEVAHCFYIILKGSVSVYARREEENAETTQLQDYAAPVRGQKERSALFGAELGNLSEGKSFGEMAITGGRKERNATLIADEPTDLVSVDRELYNRLFKVHNHEWQEKAAFVNACPLFESWSATFKSFLIENLKASTYSFSNRVVKQGSECERILFIAKGWAKLLVDLRLCEEQHRALQPKRPPIKSKKENIWLSEDEAPKKDITDPMQPMNVIQRRRHRLEHGFVAMETRLRRRDVHVTTIGPNDVIGDLEMILGLPTYCASVECVESLQVYELDKPSFQQLIVRRNPDTLDCLTQVAIVKLRFRHAQFAHIPLFESLLERTTTAQEKDKPTKKRRQTLPVSNGTHASQRKTTAVQLVKPLGFTRTDGGNVTGQKPAMSDKKAEEKKHPGKKDLFKLTAMKLRAAKKKMPAPGKTTVSRQKTGTDAAKQKRTTATAQLIKPLGFKRTEGSNVTGQKAATSATKTGEKQRPEKEEPTKNKLIAMEMGRSTKTTQAQGKMIGDIKGKDKKRSDKKDTTSDKFTSVELKALKKKIEAQQRIISDRKAEEKNEPEKKGPAKNHFAAMELKALKKKMEAEGKIISDKKAERKKQPDRRESLKNHLAAIELRSLKKKMQADEKMISDRKTEEKKRPDKKDTATKKFQAEGKMISDKKAKDNKCPEKKEPPRKQSTAAEVRALKKKVNARREIIRRCSTHR